MFANILLARNFNFRVHLAKQIMRFAKKCLFYLCRFHRQEVKSLPGPHRRLLLLGGVRNVWNICVSLFAICGGVGVRIFAVFGKFEAVADP